MQLPQESPITFCLLYTYPSLASVAETIILHKMSADSLAANDTGGNLEWSSGFIRGVEAAFGCFYTFSACEMPYYGNPYCQHQDYEIGQLVVPDFASNSSVSMQAALLPHSLSSFSTDSSVSPGHIFSGGNLDQQNDQPTFAHRMHNSLDQSITSEIPPGYWPGAKSPACPLAQEQQLHSTDDDFKGLPWLAVPGSTASDDSCAVDHEENLSTGTTLSLQPSNRVFSESQWRRNDASEENFA